jgi:UDP-3-O-[3-hydroxymyristoyl] glucosamine N-acyltransferase
MTLREIARIVGGTVVGNADAEIARLAKIEDAESGDITFIANPKYLKFLLSTGASAVLMSKGVPRVDAERRSSPISIVEVPDAYLAFLKIIDVFHPEAQPLPRGIHPTAVVAASARIGPDAGIGAHVVIGERCVIGARVTIYPGTVLYDDVMLGDDVLLDANVTIREQCRVGNRSVIHSGAVIGADGFGFAPKADGVYEKIPQRGIVVIEDDVEIGANTAIDRATIGETRIRQGAKLDNLVQIAHNVVIGKNTVIAGQSGISGSTKLGDSIQVGGQVGFAGHLKIADKSSFGAQSGIGKSIDEPGGNYFGSPIKELRRAYKIEAILQTLPELAKEFDILKRKIAELEARLAQHTSDVS